MDDRERDSSGNMGGETQMRYRLVFEFEDSLNSHKKGPDGKIAIYRMEFFVEDERSFFFINSALTSQIKVTRAEAVILKDETILNWKDRNPGEDE